MTAEKGRPGNALGDGQGSGDNRVDLTVSKEMELEEFEDMSKVFTNL